MIDACTIYTEYLQHVLQLGSSVASVQLELSLSGFSQSPYSPNLAFHTEIRKQPSEILNSTENREGQESQNRILV